MRVPLVAAGGMAAERTTKDHLRSRNLSSSVERAGPKFPLVDLAGRDRWLARKGLMRCHQTKTVLVVDDEDSLRDFAAKLIEKRGYGVLTAANGTDALAILKSGARIDLVVLDVMMPGLDGLQTLEQIRKLEIENLFVILLTARSDDARSSRLQNGADLHPKRESARVLKRRRRLIGSSRREPRGSDCALGLDLAVAALERVARVATTSRG